MDTKKQRGSEKHMKQEGGNSWNSSKTLYCQNKTGSNLNRTGRHKTSDMLNTNTIRLQRLLDINGDMLTLTMIVAHVDILFSLKETYCISCPGYQDWQLPGANKPHFRRLSHCELSHKHLFIFNVAKMIKCFCCLHDISYSEGTRDVLSCKSVKWLFIKRWR